MTTIDTLHWLEDLHANVRDGDPDAMTIVTMARHGGGMLAALEICARRAAFTKADTIEDLRRDLWHIASAANEGIAAAKGQRAEELAG